MSKIAITLRKSKVGSNKKQLANLEALGLRKIGHKVEHLDSPQIRGMVKKIEHLVTVEKAGEV